MSGPAFDKVPKLKRELAARRVQLREEAKTSLGVFPIGAQGVVSDANGGGWVTVTLDRCPHCGTRPRIAVRTRDFGNVFGLLPRGTEP